MSKLTEGYLRYLVGETHTHVFDEGEYDPDEDEERAMAREILALRGVAEKGNELAAAACRAFGAETPENMPSDLLAAVHAYVKARAEVAR